MTRITSATLGTALAAALTSLTFATSALATDVRGQKLDSGLGWLPPYAQWTDPSGREPVRVLGESLDDGLGELPHYREWDDPTGHRPVHAHVLGESLDSGLGELPPYAQWVDRTGRDPLAKAQLHTATLSPR